MACAATYVGDAFGRLFDVATNGHDPFLYGRQLLGFISTGEGSGAASGQAGEYRLHQLVENVHFALKMLDGFKEQHLAEGSLSRQAVTHNACTTRML
jgi:hypothetical protein